MEAQNIDNAATIDISGGLTITNSFQTGAAAVLRTSDANSVVYVRTSGMLAVLPATGRIEVDFGALLVSGGIVTSPIRQTELVSVAAGAELSLINGSSVNIPASDSNIYAVSVSGLLHMLDPTIDSADGAVAIHGGRINVNGSASKATAVAFYAPGLGALNLNGGVIESTAATGANAFALDAVGISLSLTKGRIETANTAAKAYTGTASVVTGPAFIIKAPPGVADTGISALSFEYSCDERPGRESAGPLFMLNMQCIMYTAIRKGGSL